MDDSATETTQPQPMVVHQYQYPDALIASKVFSNYSSPRKRRSQQPENDIDARRRRCALSSDRCWKTTGVPNVNATKRTNGTIDYYVKFLKYTKTDMKKGSMKSSQKFNTQYEAEANIFQCRYKEETPASRKMVDEHLAKETSSPEKPMVSTAVDVVSTTAKSTIKNGRFSRAKAMSGAPQQRNSSLALPALNPKLSGPFNRYNSTVNHGSSINDQQYFSAWKIFEKWKSTKDHRATARLLKVVEEQGERLRLIADLNEKIDHNNWIELLEGTSPGSELELCATPNDASRVMMQAKAVC